MAYTKVVIDWTKKVGCIDCIKFRRAHTKPQGMRHDWHVCNQHRKCVDFQHLAHQPKTEGSLELSAESAQEYYNKLAEIETEDGSQEREMNKLSENRNEQKNNLFHAEGVTMMTCKDPMHDYCQNKQAEAELDNKHPEIKPSKADSSLLSILLPMCAKARAACEGHATRA